MKLKLYFAGSTFGGVLKIGVSCNPERRIVLLTQSCPFDLTLYAVFEPSNPRRAESRLHHALRAYRTRGEWFLLAGPVIELVRFAQNASNLQQVITEAERPAMSNWKGSDINSEYAVGRPRHCAFCGQSHLLAAAMVTGRVANICDECVGACQAVIDERHSDQPLHDGLQIPDRGLENAVSVLADRK